MIPHACPRRPRPAHSIPLKPWNFPLLDPIRLILTNRLIFCRMVGFPNFGFEQWVCKRVQQLAACAISARNGV